MLRGCFTLLLILILVPGIAWALASKTELLSETECSDHFGRGSVKCAEYRLECAGAHDHSAKEANAEQAKLVCIKHCVDNWIGDCVRRCIDEAWVVRNRLP